MDNNTIQTVLLYIQILTLVALILYTWQTWKMASATRRSVQEMKEQRDAEIAPYVVAYLDSQGEIKGLLYLVIKNTGKTVAKDVRIKFDPPLQSDFPEDLQKMFPVGGIPSIPPGYEIKTTIANFVRYKEPKPMAFAVDIAYFGGISTKLREDKYQIDLTPFRGIITSMETKPPSDEANAIEKINSTNELMVEELQKITKALSRGRIKKRLGNPRNMQHHI